MGQSLHEFFSSTELLQYFTSTGVTFAASDDSLAATNIETGWTAGDRVTVAGSSQAANNADHVLATVATGKLTVTTTDVIADDNAGETITIKQFVASGGNAYQKVDCYSRIVGIVSASQNCTVSFFWSANLAATGAVIQVDYAVTGGTPLSFNVVTVAPYLKIKITNGTADQTTFNATFWAAAL